MVKRAEEVGEAVQGVEAPRRNGDLTTNVSAEMYE